jgi:peptidoglycan/LPS O-acetylase OafA/YrhL
VPPTSSLAEDLRAPSRWPALDGVRGLAVLSVVLYHGVRLVVLGSDRPGGGDASPLWWPASTARFALDAFFVLSGFLVIGSWRTVRRRHGHAWPAAREYAARRAARILPAYWISLIVLIPLLAPHLLASPEKLGLFASVQQYLVPGLPSEVNVVYWSLTTEVHFYVVAPLLGVLLGRFAGWKVVGAFVAVTVAWRFSVPAGLPPSLVIGRLEQFAVGGAAADLVRAHERGETSWVVAALRRRGVGVVIGVTLLVLGVFQGFVLEGLAPPLASHLLHPAVAIVVAGAFVRILTADRTSFLEHPGLRLAGLVSYGVYLFHWPVLALGLRASGIEPGRAGPPLLAAAVVLALSVVAFLVGTVSYVVVERPFLRIGRTPTPGLGIDLRDAARVHRRANLGACPTTATSTTSSARPA